MGLLLLTATIACEDPDAILDEDIAHQESAATYTVNCSEDAYVSKNAPTSNFGAAPTLLSGLTPDYRIYLKCTIASVVPGVTVAVSTAKLRLWVTDASTNGPAVHMAQAYDWTETGITWDNQPNYTGPALENKGYVPCMEIRIESRLL